MNPLKILLVLSLIIYFSIYEIRFLLYYISTIILYSLFSEFLFGKEKIKSSKLSFFMTMWSSPYDPQMYSRIKINLFNSNLVKEKIEKDSNIKISKSAICCKVLGEILKNNPLANTKILFGKILPRNSCDVSIMTSFLEKSSLEIITIKNCDQKNIIEIQNELDENLSKLNNGSHKEHNLRFKFSSICPTL